MHLLYNIMLGSAYILGAVFCVAITLLVTYMGYIIWRNERDEAVRRGTYTIYTPRR